jgi:hypothetical protein
MISAVPGPSIVMGYTQTCSFRTGCVGLCKDAAAHCVLSGHQKARFYRGTMLPRTFLNTSAASAGLPACSSTKPRHCRVGWWERGGSM